MGHPRPHGGFPWSVGDARDGFTSRYATLFQLPFTSRFLYASQTVPGPEGQGPVRPAHSCAPSR